MFYKKIPIKECGDELILLTDEDFVLETFYFNQGISDTTDMKLRRIIVDKLREGKKLLPEGHNFKIFDGFRVLSTQKQLFDGLYNYYRDHNPHWDEAILHEKTEMFVAVPRYDKNFPSPHNTGGAVDLTIVDEDGNELQMGTVFDEFSERGLAFTDYFAEISSDEEREFHNNRMLLKGIMEKLGFTNYEYEWWHFSHGDQMWAALSGEDCAIFGSMEL